VNEKVLVLDDAEDEGGFIWASGFSIREIFPRSYSVLEMPETWISETDILGVYFNHRQRIHHCVRSEYDDQKTPFSVEEMPDWSCV
jgi:hypothetical protein